MEKQKECPIETVDYDHDRKGSKRRSVGLGSIQSTVVWKTDWRAVAKRFEGLEEKNLFRCFDRKNFAAIPDGNFGAHGIKVEASVSAHQGG